MDTVIYCVETFWRNRGRLESGQLRQYGQAELASAVARCLAKRKPGVLVYRISGDAAVDFWDEPQIIWRSGDVPGEAA